MPQIAPASPPVMAPTVSASSPQSMARTTACSNDVGVRIAQTAVARAPQTVPLGGPSAGLPDLGQHLLVSVPLVGVDQVEGLGDGGQRVLAVEGPPHELVVDRAALAGRRVAVGHRGDGAGGGHGRGGALAGEVRAPPGWCA